MIFEIQKISSELIQEARDYFPKRYCEDLKAGSLVARFLISKKAEEEFGIKDFLPAHTEVKKLKSLQKRKNGEIFFSISHKKNYVAVAISRKEIGIDLEILQERDKSLFNYFTEKEWSNLEGKNWQNFYILWTAKEALIKKLQLKLDNLRDINLIKKEGDKLTLQFARKNFLVESFRKGGLLRTEKNNFQEESLIYSLA